MDETYTRNQMVDRVMASAVVTCVIMVVINLIISSTLYTKPSEKQRLHIVCEYLHGQVHGDICTVNGQETPTRNEVQK